MATYHRFLLNDLSGQHLFDTLCIALTPKGTSRQSPAMYKNYNTDTL